MLGTEEICLSESNPLPDPTDDGEVNFGGVSFDPINENQSSLLTVSIRVQDDINPWPSVHENGAVKLTICQNWDPENNITCGEPENGNGEAEPNVTGCLPGESLNSGPKLDLPGARKDRPVVVFIQTFWGCPTFLIPDAAERPGGGTSGKIRLSW